MQGPGVRDTAKAVNTRATSARAVTQAALEITKRVQPRLNLFTQVLEASALAAAERVDARIAAGEQLELAGVPVAIKDNLCTGPDLHAPGDGLGVGGNTTCASRLLERYASPYTATTVQRLLDAGAIVIGKTNMDEFGMGSSTERSIFGASRNPWDESRVCGGSSGGSAGAVASGACLMALGSDTGGSIRQPASHCGVVGIKPTYGRASRYGLVAYASSLDTVGVLARDVSDAALGLRIICGHDVHDGTSSQLPVSAWDQAAPAEARTLRVAVPKQARSPGNDPQVTAVLEATIAQLAQSGVTLEEVDLPALDHAVAAYYIIAPAEASSNLARFDGIRYGRRASDAATLETVYERSRSQGFGEEVQRRIMLGTHVLSSGYYDAYYAKASKVRRLILNQFEAVYARGYAAVLLPASPGPAFEIGSKTNDALAMYLEDVYTVAVNLAGLPAMSVPCGTMAQGGAKLPVGMQLVCAPFAEEAMLQAAALMERVVKG
jgi:aspartyl-tRNA(Asn)/glutamyl-tRNA(Gln) amidotransferase subunit A